MRKTSPGWLAFAAISCLVTNSGCALGGRQYPLSKWAMDNPRYASEHGAPDSPDPMERSAQHAWDMSDARFQAGREGTYLSGGSTASGHFPAAIGSTGFIHLPNAWSTVRYGVMGMDNGGLGVGGVEAGIRLHAPTRFTPYVGLSTDMGISNVHTGPTHNQNSGRQRSTITKASGMAAIVPEAGVSYWLTSSTRLNAGASYFVAVDQPDFFMFGLSLEFLSPEAPGSSKNAVNSVGAVDAIGNRLSYDGSTGPYFVQPGESVAPNSVVPVAMTLMPAAAIAQ